MKRFATLCLLSLTSLSSFSQKKQDYNIAFKSDVLIDGKSVEWNDLTNVDDAGKWSYKVAHDKTNLYVAIRIQDSMMQNAVATEGIMVKFPAADKKKKDRVFVYPYLDKEVKRALRQAAIEDPIALVKSNNTDLIHRSRGFVVLGFPTILEGLLSLQNNYGLKAVIGTDDEGMFYEAVIPKDLLAIAADNLAIELQINDFAAMAAQKKNKQKHPKTTTVLRLQGRLVQE